MASENERGEPRSSLPETGPWNLDSVSRQNWENSPKMIRTCCGPGGSQHVEQLAAFLSLHREVKLPSLNLNSSSVNFKHVNSTFSTYICPMCILYQLSVVLMYLNSWQCISFFPFKFRLSSGSMIVFSTLVEKNLLLSQLFNGSTDRYFCTREEKCTSLQLWWKA